jgi:hypothetical protein
MTLDAYAVWNAEIVDARKRIADLEADLERLSKFLQSRHGIGKVKHIGLREAVPAALDVIDGLERKLRAVKRKEANA